VLPRPYEAGEITAFQVDLSYWTGYWRDGVQGRAGEGQLVR
jgi:hypothetical protein